MNATQQCDRSRYPQPIYPKQGKPNFTPTTTPRGYGTPSRGGKRRGRGRGRYRNVNYNNTRTPQVYIPPTDVKQNTTVRFRDRLPYWHGVCTKCGLPGHHADSHDELQQFRSTIAFYFRNFFRELNQSTRKTNTRRMNNMTQSNDDSNSDSPTTITTTQSNATSQGEETFFTPQ